LNNSDKKLLNTLIDNLPKLQTLMDNQELNEYIKTVVSFSFDANKYFNDSEPWSLKKKDPERMNAILFTIVEQIKNISILLNPIIPNATNKALAMINISIDNLSIDKIKDKNIFNHKKELGDLEILFNKIEDDN
jgi:methionyl-tRNA synthetase